MCTVSFVPSPHHGIIITSNRDEKVLREPASLPHCFEVNGNQLFYPVDGKAKGTWFIVRDDASVGVLLNGAFVPHQVQPTYTMSRGNILPHIFKFDSPIDALESFDLFGVENFTLLVYHQQKLFDCKWDGKQLFIVQLNERVPYIYSSVTLYNKTMVKQREEWFRKWLQFCNSPTQQQAIHFHSTAGKGNHDHGLKMNRNNHLQTVSITSVCIHEQVAKLIYKDLTQEQYDEQDISIHYKKMVESC